MAKYDAFGTALKIAELQSERATAVGTITSSGDMTVTVTSDGMAGSPLAITVAVLDNDTPDMWAAKVRAELALNATIAARFTVGGSGPYIELTRIVPAAPDATLNIAAGFDYVTVASVTNLSGPGIAVDTEDVTSHDSTGAWEELVVTIIRSGEVTADIVYDPVADSHDGTATSGLVYSMKNKVKRHFSITFSDAANTVWSFPGYVTGFEPSEPVDGALTASVTIKIDAVPSLA
jgi:predicted secreted protein